MYKYVKKKNNQSGFTLIELLMVILLVSILAAVSLPQFVDFRSEAKDAATKSALGTLRTSISNQYANIALRCAVTPGAFPGATQIANNSVTAGTTPPCTVAQVANATDRQFVVGGVIPDNPWSGSTATKNSVAACTGAGCTTIATLSCDGTAYNTTTHGGWCYDSYIGKIWPNSSNSTGSAKETTF